ncbi:MAG: MFS transporter, partial [Firmicutes bacterium]|nr:MFS transporter [Bacillota bacterium]
KFGDDFTEIAIAVFVLNLSHHNPAAVGLVISMMFWPRMLWGGIVAGIISRFHRKQLLLVSNIAHSILILSIPLIHQLWWAITAMFLMYSLASFYQPTINAITPVIAEDTDMLSYSNATLSRRGGYADLLAYAIGGSFLIWLGFFAAFSIDALSYLLAAFLLLQIRRDESTWQPTAQEKSLSFRAQLAEGGKEYARNKTLLALSGISFLIMLAISGINVLPAPAMRTLWHQPSAHFSWFLLAMALGVSVGSKLIEHRLHINTFRRLMVSGLIGVGVVSVLLSYSTNIEEALLLAFALGILNAFFMTTVMTWIQHVVPRHNLSRVFSLNGLLIGLGGGLGAILSGTVAHAFTL